MKIICPATQGEVDTDYCGGDCIDCPWFKIEKSDSDDRGTFILERE